jgi:hypothetical protein
MLLFAVPAAAQPDADVAAAAGVVLQQLDAFRRGDFDTAYGFASTTIRELFDRRAFEEMVTRGYPEIAQSTSAYVASHRRTDAAIYLVLRIRGANGNAIEAVYELVPERGSFRVNGVVARPDGTSASASTASVSASAVSRRTSSVGSVAPPNRTRS